jgi:hypothetical protein
MIPVGTYYCEQIREYIYLNDDEMIFTDGKTCKEPRTYRQDYKFYLSEGEKKISISPIPSTSLKHTRGKSDYSFSKTNDWSKFRIGNDLYVKISPYVEDDFRFI